MVWRTTTAPAAPPRTGGNPLRQRRKCLTTAADMSSSNLSSKQNFTICPKIRFYSVRERFYSVRERFDSVRERFYGVRERFYNVRELSFGVRELSFCVRELFCTKVKKVKKCKNEKCKKVQK